jgi:hypothetical protein
MVDAWLIISGAILAGMFYRAGYLAGRQTVAKNYRKFEPVLLETRATGQQMILRNEIRRGGKVRSAAPKKAEVKPVLEAMDRDALSKALRDEINKGKRANPDIVERLVAMNNAMVRASAR